VTKNNKVVVFTDGACSGNPGPGGWAAILISPLGKVRELGGREERTTNNRMELRAALEALLALANVKQLSTKEIRIYTDSTYMIRGIQSWVHGWKRNGWKTQAGTDVSNRELWEALLEAIQKHEFEIEWLYVPGHKGYPGNERCDQIAVAYSQGSEPKLFQCARADYPVNVDRVPPPSPLPDPNRKKGPAVYLSLVDGKVHRDKDWKSCEARVKGRQGVKFKKVESPEEEEEILRSWGLKT
jgi:ribonuclease HI